MKATLKRTLMLLCNSIIPKVWRFYNSGGVTYNANAYIGLSSADADNTDSSTISYNAGIFRIKKPGRYLINAHIAIQTQTNNREYIKLERYDTGEVLAQSIYYGNWAICNINRVIQVNTNEANNYSVGIKCMEKLNINFGGIGPSYIEFIKLGGGSA